MTEQKGKIAKIVVDRSKCISAATCVVIAAKAFELDGDGIAVVKPTYLEHTDEEIIQAAQSCPTLAISLYDENDQEIKL